MNRTITIAHRSGGAVNRDTVTGFARLSCGDVLIAEHAHWNAGPPISLNYAYLLRADGRWVRMHLPARLTEFIARSKPGERAKVSGRNVEILDPQTAPSIIAVVPVRTVMAATAYAGDDLF